MTPYASETVLVGAVVVHHRSYDTVKSTVDALAGGVTAPSTIVVVDNSEEPERAGELERAFGTRAAVLRTSNKGYGAAVNAGIEWLRSELPDMRYLVVATHEARADPMAVRELVAALEYDSRAGIAGPTLRVHDGAEQVWSTGGFLTRVLRLPRHFDHRAEGIGTDVGTVERTWVDGAFVLYRVDALNAASMDESYFLYMEEVDYHLRLRRAGWTTLHVPAAQVWQSSSGIPPYSLARNMQLFQHAHGTRRGRVFAAPWSIAHRALSNVVHGRRPVGLVAMLRGWRDGLRGLPHE
ncbi:glycosyltransferase family 2 protein [Rhodococcus sp. IEGM 1343]|uniref:glycosyltransferase family 2 protein n=1 Tax=Rhodococcus sp. IEGM 1343 TaxID=3082224 RepID=UPI002954DA92|nr:glycosyltransferase family 2 protein [Rhodococcus sp. IEGM 1343]MDV8055967.1 glycosyltransferase family 2 protein [Rhodococcus sp. IEGM 1343]